MKYATMLLAMVVSTLNGADKKKRASQKVEQIFGICTYKNDPRSKRAVLGAEKQKALQIRVDRYKQLQEVIPPDLLHAMLPEARKEAETYNATLEGESDTNLLKNDSIHEFQAHIGYDSQTDYSIYLTRFHGREYVIEKEVKIKAEPTSTATSTTKTEHPPATNASTTTTSTNAIDFDELFKDIAAMSDIMTG